MTWQPGGHGVGALVVNELHVRTDWGYSARNRPLIAAGQVGYGFDPAALITSTVSAGARRLRAGAMQEHALTRIVMRSGKHTAFGMSERVTVSGQRLL